MCCFLCFNPIFHLPPWLSECLPLWSEKCVNCTHQWGSWLTYSAFRADAMLVSLSLLSLRCLAGGSSDLHAARPTSQPTSLPVRGCGQYQWPHAASVNALHLNHAFTTNQSWEHTTGLNGSLVWPKLFCPKIAKMSKGADENVKLYLSTLCHLKCNNFLSQG